LVCGFEQTTTNRRRQTKFEFGAEHAGGVEAPGELAVGGDGDEAAFSVDGGELFLDDLIGRGLQAHVFVFDQGADGSGDGVADEVFSDARPGNRARLVRRIRSRSNQWRIANTVPALGREPSAFRCWSRTPE